MADQDNAQGQKITFEQKMIKAMPQEVMRFKMTIENPEPLIKELFDQIVKQAGEIARLKVFVKDSRTNYIQTMKGGVIVGICPFSVN